MQVFYTILIDYIVFETRLSVVQLLGAFVIVLVNVYITVRKSKITEDLRVPLLKSET